MVTPSFIPPRPQRDLRDLTRRRRKLIQDAVAEKNRVAKVLEDANVKVGSVLSDQFGASGSWCWRRCWREKPTQPRWPS